jgi:hypothetical protein
MTWWPRSGGGRASRGALNAKEVTIHSSISPEPASGDRPDQSGKSAQPSGRDLPVGGAVGGATNAVAIEGLYDRTRGAMSDTVRWLC